MWAILVISGRNCNWHLVRGSHGCWNTSTLCQTYRRTLQHCWVVLQGQKPCVVQSPEHWLLYHSGAKESTTSSGLHLELPACESWARGCVVLTRTLVILMHLCFRDTGRCDSFLFCFKIYKISCLLLSFLLPFWLVDRMWSQAFSILRVWLASRPLCAAPSPVLWSQEALFEKWSVSSDLLCSEVLAWVNTGL